MRQIRFKLNGTDYSNAVVPYSFTETQRRVEGKNGMMTLDGTYIEDLIAVKYDIALQVMPLESATLNAIAAELSNPYVEVEYFSPLQNEIVTKWMIPTASTLATLLLNGTGNLYGDMTLSFMEK